MALKQITVNIKFSLLIEEGNLEEVTESLTDTDSCFYDELANTLDDNLEYVDIPYNLEGKIESIKNLMITPLDDNITSNL